MEYQVCKYRGKWAVYQKTSRVYYFIGCGKKYCEIRAKELNNGGN